MTSILESQMQAAEQECLNSWKQGPTRLRWSKLPLQVGDPAPDFELPDSSGKLVNLKGFWSDRPTLLLFWRHYGCGCGVDRASRLQKEYDDYISAGANIVIIGQGEPERATAYAMKYNLPPIAILSDPELRVYAAYGLLEGKPSQIVFDAPDEFLRRDYEAFAGLAKARREAGRPLVDSPWQLPGEFVIDHSGVVRLAYRYQYCEDWPNPLVLIAAIKEAIWESK
ncbi:MAG: peroxiredoxin-like family protein [Anaerolineae bacterium]